MPWQDVHHRIPLEFAHLFPAVEGAQEFRGLLHPNRLENLRVVNRPTHRVVHVWWNYFKATYAVDADTVRWAEKMIAEGMRWSAM